MRPVACAIPRGEGDAGGANGSEISRDRPAATSKSRRSARLRNYLMVCGDRITRLLGRIDRRKVVLQGLLVWQRLGGKRQPPIDRRDLGQLEVSVQEEAKRLPPLRSLERNRDHVDHGDGSLPGVYGRLNLMVHDLRPMPG